MHESHCSFPTMKAVSSRDARSTGSVVDNLVHHFTPCAVPDTIDCYDVNFHARLINTKSSNGNTGCLAGSTGGATSFKNGRANSQNKVVAYNGTDGEGNYCDIKGGDLCQSGAGPCESTTEYGL